MRSAIVQRLYREDSRREDSTSILSPVDDSDDASESVHLLAMGRSDDSLSSGAELPQTDIKAFPEAVVASSGWFSKSEGRTTFETSSLDSHYKPIDSYEGRHRYDPDFEWTPAEEKKVVRKIDYKICSWVCLMFFALQLDRGNISQALSDNMLDDLGLTTNEYNTGQTIFYLCFLFAELPSQLISKAIGPDNWIPIQMVTWSLVASMQAFLSGRNSFWACRALLGMCEGGFIPDNILYLSYWYTGLELPVRLSFFWGAYQGTSIVSAFMAFGILHMRGINGLAGWRWLFALEGLLTGMIGIVSWFYLPPSPTQTASRFRGKEGWFDEREEKIMVNRVLRDDPSKGDMHNRQAIDFGMFWACLKDYHMWPIYLIGVTWLVPQVPMSAYLTLVLKSAGYGTFETNLLSIPAYVLFIINLFFWTWLSEKVNDRFLIGTISQIWVLPLLIAFETLGVPRNSWVTWALSVLQYGQPYVHAILVAVTSRNAGTVRTRTVATALYNMCVQASNIIGTNVYRTEDKPYYFRGNKVLIGLACYSFALFIFAKFFYVTVNRRREKVWSAMSKEEKDEYLSTTQDKGNKRLDFRFSH
ncbi:hypothetical protein LTR56_006350 [Elasticomyces elasticus]|nr:hypothetical protein LTR56_006350 [Elasticomyces elasticus]KAK3663395.1 hypothetical protein LTR22_005805 [Elasticomyces elasticus]KAK4925474.1 hypothetical protein LTR49_007541 [Elasticomyces elasticus]KAK5764569.1 hypothetical protein LTS12_005302 [Elasticomyces elasticus]